MKYSVLLTFFVLIKTVDLEAKAQNMQLIRRKTNSDSNKWQTCGKSAYISGERIVGGRAARDGEFPWQISIYRFNSMQVSFCGGSIIDKNTILTAAHCVSGKGTLAVIRYNSLYYDFGGSVAPDCKIIIHPNYNNITGENDIAILKVPKPLVLGQLNSGAVCLPAKNLDPKPGKVLTVSGWGETQLDGDQPLFLNTVNVTVSDRNACRTPFERFGAKVTNQMICAANSQRGVCFGDSGGPLVDYSSGSAVIFGIVSETYFCGRDNAPDIYTRVSAYLDWINKYRD